MNRRHPDFRMPPLVLAGLLERSATLSNWTTIRTDTANVNPMTVTDFATNRMNFYRVRRLPNP